VSGQGIKRDWRFALAALLLAFLIVRLPNERPGFTDAYYHFNAAVRLAQGDGFVDDYLWTYIGAPDALPARSHLYWTPGTSILAAVGMALFGLSYGAAQVSLWLCLWGGALLTYHLALVEAGKLRHAWAAGLLVLFGGFFGRMWGTTDTFAPYLFFGGVALYLMQRAVRADRWQAWLLAGLFSGAGHLIRSDGLLLLLTGLCVLVLLRRWSSVPSAAALVGSYLVVMGPWFAFNYATLGTLLPVGGTQAIWYTTYDDLFNFPPAASAERFFANGLDLLIASRAEAFITNLQTLLFVQGFLILFPLMLVGAWRRRADHAWWPVFIFTVGLHAAFTFVFPFPGMRGGLFHGAAALMPFWAALALDGLDRAVEWVARRRRHWRAASAQRVFTAAAVLLVMGFSVVLMFQRRVTATTPIYFETLREVIPAGSRVMRNDPAELYFFTGIGGVVLPNEPYNVVEELVRLYEIDFVLLEYPNVPRPLYRVPVPEEWELIPLSFEGVELYDTRRPAP
jgi:4-amino-4-deoxy-L-arabinose transferase-like glycosyltransferase